MLRKGFTCLRLQLRRGFTAIELIVVLGIFVIAIAATLPFLGKLQEAETLQSVSQDVIQTLRRAQNRAMTGQHGTAWGVMFGEQEFILYGGKSFVDRTERFDERHVVSDVFSFLGLNDVTFSPLTGKPSVEGSIHMTHPEGGTVSITVNNAGGIFFSSE